MISTQSISTQHSSIQHSSIQLKNFIDGICLLTDLPKRSFQENNAKNKLTFSKPCLLLSKQEEPSLASQFSYFMANPTQCLSFSDQDKLEQWHTQQSFKSSSKTSSEKASQLSKSSLEVDKIPLHSGWVGVYSYPSLNTKKLIENDIPLDIAEFHYYPWVICLDHKTNILYLLGEPDDAAKAAFSAIQQQTELPPNKRINLDFQPTEPNSDQFKSEALKATVFKATVFKATVFKATVFKATWDKPQYKAAFNTIQNYLVSGDCYQVNLTHPHTSHYSGSALDAVLPLYKALNPSFGCYFEGIDFELISVSPERFMSISPEGKIEAKPIKGTVRRSNDPIQDQELIDKLKSSQKDQAENLMIVDLLRNDLSISATPNSVKVTNLFELETHPNVHHLVSTIHAKMKDSLSAPQTIKNAFPGGSITGAPKKRAMEIIEELEAQPRSLYCGSFGYYSDTGHTDFNILIRSLEFRNNTITCWGGGGITIDSNCDEEYEESLTKVRQIMTTIENI